MTNDEEEEKKTFKMSKQVAHYDSFKFTILSVDFLIRILKIQNFNSFSLKLFASKLLFCFIKCKLFANLSIKSFFFK